MNYSRSDTMDRIPPDRRDAEIKRLQEENEKLRARADEAHERARKIAASSKRFASFMRERGDERRCLAAQYAVMKELSEAESLESAAPRILGAFGARLGWSLGILWVLDEGQSELRCAGVWRPQSTPPGRFEEACGAARVRFGAGPVGRAWAEGMPVWVEDLGAEETPSKAEAAGDGLRESFVFPIRNGRFHGVAQFLCSGEHSPPEEGLQRTAEIVGRQIGQFAERREAEQQRDRLLARERAAREEAQTAHERTDEVLESIADAFFALDGEQRFAYVNREAERLWGRAREDLIGRKAWEEFPQAVGSESHEAIERTFRRGEAASFEEVSAVTGAWISGRAYPTTGGGVSVLFRDITERKRAEEALRASEEKYRTLFESIDEGFCIIEKVETEAGEPPDFRYVDANPSFAVQSGVGGVVGKTIREAFPGAPEEGFEIYDTVLRTGEPIRFEVEVPTIGRVLELYAFRVEDEARLLRVAVIFKDITERKRAEEALREGEERYRSLVTATSSIVWTAAPSGECVAEMPSWEEFTGQTFEQYRGFGWLDAVHPDDRPPADAWDDLAPEEAPLEVEYRLRRRDGEYRRVISRGVPVLDESGGVHEWVGTMSDVEEKRLAEEANAYLATVVRSSGEALIGLSPDGEIESWNPAAERLYGYSAEEAIGQPISLVAAPDRNAEQSGMMDVLRSERTVNLETTRLTKGGRRVEVLISVSPVLDAEGRNAGFSATITDITERKRAEKEREELRRIAEEERAHLEAILQQMPGGVFIADPSGEFILANEGTERIYGKRLRSVEECGEHTLSYPDGREMAPEEYPLVRALAGGFVSGMEHYVLRADGTRGVVSANAAPVLDEEGRIVAAVKAFEDVTRQKEAQSALRESEQRLRTVVQGTPVVLFSLDRVGVYTLAEGQGLRAVGLGPDELVGRSVFDVFEDEPELVASARRALAGESFAESVSARDRVFEVWYNPLRDERGAVSGVTGVATDVTDRRRAEEERDRSRARELEARAAVEDARKRLAYFAGAREERKIISRELHDRVAHSMAVVRQCLELHDALKEHNPEAAGAKIELAKDEAKVALNSTRDLSMMLRRSEVEEMGLEKALAGMLETTVPNGVYFEVSVEGDEALVPHHVGNQLFLILREAVRNAIAHAGCRSIAVELEVLPERVAASVQDDGRGFDGNSEGHNGENGGVGLRSMKERAALLAGNLDLTSAPGAGTQVEVSIPLAAARAAASDGQGDPLGNTSGGVR